eukprot:m.203741 g.203741  ORF g.203741 m.203741 type:complete len:496 (+) comp18858_c1_seq4:194-1681(+)
MKVIIRSRLSSARGFKMASRSMTRLPGMPDVEHWDKNIKHSLLDMKRGGIRSLDDFYKCIASYRSDFKLAGLAGFEHAVRGLNAPTCEQAMPSAQSTKSDIDGVSHFLSEVLPSIATSALRLEQLHLREGTPLSLLQPQHNARVRLAQEDAKCLLANMLLLTLPSDCADSESFDMPWTNFGDLMSKKQPHEVAKLQCILHFFDHTRTAPLAGSVVYSRHVTPPERTREDFWSTCDAPLNAVVLRPKGCSIDDADPKTVLHMDFANEYLGGGVLCGGCVQEEIRFSVSPLCIPAMLLCPGMEANEAISLHGCLTYSATKGYGSSLRYAGHFDDVAPVDRSGTPLTTIVAIDAIPYHGGASVQFHTKQLLRDTVKAYTGFSVTRDTDDEAPAITAVATGNWGCGAFGGYIPLKACLQWMAASAAGREMHYYVFDADLLELEQFSRACVAAKLTVQDLWAAIGKIQEKFARKQELQKILHEQDDAWFWQFLREHLGLQ